MSFQLLLVSLVIYGINPGTFASHQPGNGKGQVDGQSNGLAHQLHELRQEQLAMSEAIAELQRPRNLCQSGVNKKLGQSVTIMFDPPFEEPPQIVWGIDQIDASNSKNLRIVVHLEDITKDSVTFRLTKWNNTILYAARMRWMACPATI